MKTMPLIPPGRRGILLGIANALLAVVLTVLSFRYIQPPDCYRSCGELSGADCQIGGCVIGEQKAGWPLPAFIDSPGGGSPVSGWGILGQEDLPFLVGILLDVLFYSVLLWIAFAILQAARKRALPLRLIGRSLLLNVFLAAILWFVYFIPNHPPIGNGRNLGIYIDTPTGVIAASAFYPASSLPVGDLIESYGEPDEVRIHPTGPLGDPTLHTVLHWDALGMYVGLREAAGFSYTVKKTTTVEWITFFTEVQVIRIAGEPLGEKEIPWKGYGDYLP